MYVEPVERFMFLKHAIIFSIDLNRFQLFQLIIKIWW